jgi:hypothetical protein
LLKNVAISAAQQVIYSIVFRQSIVTLYSTTPNQPFHKLTKLSDAHLGRQKRSA